MSIDNWDLIHSALNLIQASALLKIEIAFAFSGSAMSWALKNILAVVEETLISFL